MGEIHKTLSDGLVQLHSIALLDEFSDNLTLVVLHNQNLLRTDHLLDHDDSKVGEDLGVFVLAQVVVGQKRRIWCTP